jgi:hypothetical protein
MNDYSNYEQSGSANYNQQPNQVLPPKTYLAESILVTILCCLPFGVVGIVNAAKVESAFYAGHVERAYQLSRDAKRWTLIGLCVGLSVVFLYFIFYVICIVFSLGVTGFLF